MINISFVIRRVVLLSFFVVATVSIVSCGGKPPMVDIVELIPTSEIGTYARDESFGYNALTIKNPKYEITYTLLEGYGNLDKGEKSFMERSVYIANIRIKNLSDKKLEFDSNKAIIETVGADIKSESRIVDHQTVANYIEKIAENAPPIGKDRPVVANVNSDGAQFVDFVAAVASALVEMQKASEMDRVMKLNQIVNRWAMPDKVEIAPNETINPVMPNALPLSEGGNASVTIAAPRARIITAPKAWKIRKAISISILFEIPHKPEPVVKIIKPAT